MTTWFKKMETEPEFNKKRIENVYTKTIQIFATHSYR